MLSPMQIQRMCTNYYVADYEVRSLFEERIGLSDCRRTLYLLRFYG